MTDDLAFRHTVVVGAGAVGSYFGALLAAAGRRVTLVARDAHVRAIAANGLQLQRHDRVEAVAVEATTDLGAVASADLVLVCVKSSDTDATARALAPLVAPTALVLSLQNGIDNAPTIARHVRATVVPTVVYVATSMPSPGTVRHHGRGDLVVGPLDARDAGDAALHARLAQVVDHFAPAGVPVRIDADVAVALWRKLLVNCAYNAISALTQRPYAEIAAQPDVIAVQHALVDEFLAVMHAEGHALTRDDALAAVAQIAQTMPTQVSSTAQDLARGKPTEIDHLNGAVVKRGAARGVATPVNATLHALVRLAESPRGGG